MYSKLKIAASVLAISVVSLFAQNRPFPQAGVYTPQSSVIKPSNKTQTQLNSDVTTIWNRYKNSIKKSGNYYYVQATGEGSGGSSAITVSEANGYGMIITAIMGEKAMFDGLNALRKAATNSNGLMSWQLQGLVYPITDGATDGDLDNAYGLILAYDQWGDQTYLNEAKTLINAIKKSSMHQSTLRTALGDWDSDQNSTRSSDWMPGHFRAFATVTGDSFWNQVADNVYTMIGQCANATTGLIPDFVTGNPAKADATGGGTGEDYADRYYYNGCRDPWRLATDYYHNGTTAAKTQIDKISTWARGAPINGNPTNIKDGYYLNGTAFGTYAAPCFVAPFAAGLVSNSANQTFLNSMWTNLSTSGAEDEYNEAIRLMCMLLISGNWWAPLQVTDGKFAVTVEGGNGSGRYSPDATVSISATAPAGKAFKNWTTTDGVSFANANAASTTFKMPSKAVTVTANFEVSDPNLVDKNDLAFWEWEIPEEPDGYGSTAKVTNDMQNGKVTFDFNLAASNEAKEIYPWTNITAYFNAGDFINVTKIDIEYTSSKPVNIVLVDGDVEGRSYCYELPVATSKKTLTINISDFAQPDWCTGADKYALNKSKVIGIAIDGIAIEGQNSQVSGTITKCILTGLIINIPTHIVTFDSKGGTSVSQIKDIEDGTKINKPSDPTKNGYDFGGWYKEETLTNQFDFNTAIKASITLYAKWTPKTYSITYNLDGGTNNAGNPASYTIETSSITLKDPTKTGLYFVGWYGSSSFTGEKITSIAKGSTGNKSLFAKWSNIPVTKYKLTVESYEFEYEEGDIVTLNSNEYTPIASWLCGAIVFSSWEFGTAVGFIDGTNEKSEIVKFTMPAKNVVVGVITENVTYESVLTFSVIGGNGTLISMDYNANEIKSGDNVVCGNAYTFVAIPDIGYRVKGWKHNGEIVQNNKNNNYETEISGGESEVTVEFEPISTPIIDTPKSDNRYGIMFKQNPVSEKAEISVILPNDEKSVETKIIIYDMTGNVVFVGVDYHRPTIWNLQNNGGRSVANGTYLVIAESKSINGNAYRYSTKLGVKR